MPGAGTSIDPYICLIAEDLTGTVDNPQEIERQYEIIGPINVKNARYALLTDLVNCPSEHPDESFLYRDTVEVAEDVDAPGHYSGTVTYRRPTLNTLPAVGKERLIPGSSSSQSVRIKTALEVISTTASAGQTAINNYGLIGATKDGVEGIDEEIPSFNFGIEKHYAKGTITISLMAQLMLFHKRVSSAPWRGFAIGEVRLKDYEFDNEGDDFDIIRYYFEATPNQSNVVFPSPFGDITVDSIRGWDYVDVSMVDDPGGLPYKVPHTIAVLRTKEYANLNTII